MLIFLIIVVILFFAVIILFSFPQFSPIPYYPTNSRDLPLIIKSLGLKNNQAIYDLGAGDGTVIFAAAAEAQSKKLNTKFIAIDINPVLILIMYFKRLFHPNKKNVTIIWTDLFKLDFSHLSTFHHQSTTFYLYVSPWFLEKIISHIKKLKNHFNIVSYMYAINSLENKQKIVQGLHKIFLYNV